MRGAHVLRKRVEKVCEEIKISGESSMARDTVEPSLKDRSGRPE
jgi:hypothetical protein